MGGALLIAGIAISAFWLLAQHFTPTDEQPSNWDLVRLSLTVAAGFGGLVALVVTYRKQKDLEEGRFTEHFGAAAAQLGHSDVAVRIAGVYAMAGAADRTHEEHRQQCIDVLCGYLRLPYQPEIGNSHQILMIQRSAKETGEESEAHFQYRQNDREVRQTIVRVIRQHLVRDATYSWSQYSFDFTGAHLENVDFSGATFNGQVTQFEGATFSGKNTSFASATFNSTITNFSGTAFNGTRTNLSRAVFNGALTSFTGTKFSSDSTVFHTAIFGSNSTAFEGVTFSGTSTSFRGAMFKNNYTGFKDAVFSGKRTDFSNVTFNSKAISFRKVMFSSQDTSFYGVWFSSDSTSFIRATFSGERTSFDRVTFSGPTSFQRTDFGSGSVSFELPRRWNPAPRFDWTDGDESTPQPVNVLPQSWPPTAATNT